jgi:hypothetical protein
MSVFAASDASVEDPLLDELEAHRDESVTALTVPQVLAALELRKPLAIVCFAMLSQQLSGTFPFCARLPVLTTFLGINAGNND